MHAVVSTVRIEDVDVARGALPEQRLKLAGPVTARRYAADRRYP
jgi:hypothetical protein